MSDEETERQRDEVKWRWGERVNGGMGDFEFCVLCFERGYPIANALT